jgi:hypothetical protein
VSFSWAPHGRSEPAAAAAPVPATAQPAAARHGIGRVREALPGLEVSGAFYDVATGRVSGL